MARPRFAITPAALSAALTGDFHNAMVAATPGGIEAQEAQGQRDLCNSSQRLPKQITGNGRGPLDRSLIEENTGIRFGTDADDIFVFAELPHGWKISPTSHSMWSDLLDSKGRKRGSLFYKAAFYDRSAHLRLNARYYATSEYQDVRDHNNGNKCFQVIDSDGDKVLFKTEWFDGRKYPNADEERLEKLASDWLRERYPDHMDVFAYWD